MSELIQGLVQVRDGLSLIAFLSLVLLMAFRTQKVPEDLRSGEALEVKFRSPPFGGLAGILLYGTNGQSLDQEGDGRAPCAATSDPAARFIR